MEENINKDEQDNERLALKSIYGDDMLELFPNSFIDWAPFECIITLGPLHGIESTQSIHPVVCLHVTCSHEYPQKPPDIKVEQWKRISNKNIGILQNELEELAQKLKGDVMIYQLAQHVKTFLHSCNQPGYKSFYDEMMMRQKREQDNERRIKEAEHKKKKKEILAEIQVKGQAVKKALRKRQNSVKSLDEEFDTPCHSSVPIERPLETEDFDQMDYDKTMNKIVDDNPWILCEKGQSRFEHEFEHLSSLGKGAFGHVIKVQNKLDDGLYAIKRIVLDPSEKQLNKKITREVKLLSRLNHENVVRYYNSWLESSEIISFHKDSNEHLENQFTRTKITDQAIDMLPINEPILDWLDENSSTSDESSDDYIIFRSGSNVESDDIKSISKSDKISEGTSSTKTSCNTYNEALIMYIQMELCDKSTLRLAIDDNLYLDTTRVWRLFREIVEGLCHIHQQGIIHRDLKPVNIFIGQDDHVKIGDFGLATTIILQKQNVREPTIIQYTTESQTSQNSQQTDTSQTGQVGTTLYVAPELNCIPIKLSYNQKVDIYSLGIIFFEMCTPPMDTTMERYQILSDLRQQEPVFPSDYHLEDNSPQRRLMRSMLQYDVDKRPSAQELLQNSAIPPPKREESEVSLMIKRTFSNPQSRNYKFLIASCFEQTLQPSLDATYNVSSWRSPLFTSSLEIVCNKLRNVFQTHGATSFLPPLLTPAGQVLDSTVCLMTRFGSIVYATQDLQVPFARYLAQNHSICQMKRYAIDKIYKERPAGVHPKENYECAFDIVTPTAGDLLPEYEVLCVIWEILKEFPSILNHSCAIYFNHWNIIAVMLKVSGIDVTKFRNEKINIFKKTGFFHSKMDYEMYLKSLGISERSITSLIQWMNIEGPLNKVSQSIMSLLKDYQYIPDLKLAFYQLETLSNFTQIVGITCPVLINLGFVKNAYFYSGPMIQVVCTQKKSKQNERSVILTGGRYDSLVQSFRESLSCDDGKVNQFVVGFTLSADKLVFSIDDDEKKHMIDVLICAIGRVSVSPDKLKLLHDIWKSGLRSSFINSVETLEEIQAHCKDMKIPVLVLLKETDSGFARIRTLVKEKYCEKKINYTEILDFILKFRTSILEASGSVKPELKSQASSEGPVITFMTQDKLTPLLKRRHESQILNNVQTLLPKFASKAKIEILALSVDGDIIRTLSLYVDPNCNEPDINPILKRYPKHKKIIQRFQDHMDDIKNSIPVCVTILYSLIDNTYQVLL